MQPLTEKPLSNHRVVVIASSIEGIDALARLVDQIPSTFPVPVVVHLKGLQHWSLGQITAIKWRFSSNLNVVYANDREILIAGHVYVVSALKHLIFTNVNELNRPVNEDGSSIDELFESAARWYQSGVIGVVLSGLGTNGTKGLQSIVRVDGKCIIQSPYEAKFPSMPMNALLSVNVQHTVMLDQMGEILNILVSELEPGKTVTPGNQNDIARLILTARKDLTESLDRSIEAILMLTQSDLSLDVTFIVKKDDGTFILKNSISDSNKIRVQTESDSKYQILWQHALDHKMLDAPSDAELLKLKQDLEKISVRISIPIRLRDGSLFGLLCCFDFSLPEELWQRHCHRLQMSARQISRLVNEAGEK